MNTEPGESVEHALVRELAEVLRSEAKITGAGVAEFHWLPVGRLSASDIRPAPLKRAIAADDRQVPIWHAWAG